MHRSPGAKGRPENKGGAGKAAGQGRAKYHKGRVEYHHSRTDGGERPHGRANDHHIKADRTKDPQGGTDRADTAAELTRPMTPLADQTGLH